MITKSIAFVLVIFVNLTPTESAVLPQWVHRISSCPDPGNVSQWMEASRKLNCQNQLSSKDPKQQGHQYHCLPSSFLNETVQFCGRSVPIGPGACAVYNYEFYENTQPTSYNCSKFTSGCPGELFHSKNIFKYPECLNISKSEKCFKAEKNCSNNSNSTPNITPSHQSSVTTTDITTSHPRSFIVTNITPLQKSSKEPSWFDFWHSPLVLSLLVVAVLIIVFIIAFRRRIKKRSVSTNIESPVELQDLLQNENRTEDAHEADIVQNGPSQVGNTAERDYASNIVQNENRTEDAHEADVVQNGPSQVGNTAERDYASNIVQNENRTEDAHEADIVQNGPSQVGNTAERDYASNIVQNENRTEDAHEADIVQNGPSQVGNTAERDYASNIVQNENRTEDAHEADIVQNGPSQVGNTAERDYASNIVQNGPSQVGNTAERDYASNIVQNENHTEDAHVADIVQNGPSQVGNTAERDYASKIVQNENRTEDAHEADIVQNGPSQVGNTAERDYASNIVLNENHTQDAHEADIVQNGPSQDGNTVERDHAPNIEQDIGAQETHPEYGIHKAWKRAKRLNESEFLKGLEEAMTAKNFDLIKSKLLESTEDTEEKQALIKISENEELLTHLKKHCSLFHNLIFVQGLFLSSNAEHLYQLCLSYAKRRRNDKILFFEKEEKKEGYTKVKYKIHRQFLKNSELTEITETIMFLTGAKYDDIYVSQVSNGCVQVCFMVKNHLIPKLRKCYMPENINKTHQSLSTDFKNKIIKVVIQDEVMDLSNEASTDIHRFGNVLKPKDHDTNSKGISTQVSVKHCSLCPGDTEYYCYGCRQGLCIQCKKLHVVDLSTKHHTVTRYAEKPKYPPKQVKSSQSHDPKQVISAQKSGPPVWLSPLEFSEIQWRRRIYHLRGETIYYRSVLLEELRYDRKTGHKAVTIRGQSKAEKRGQELKEMIDKVLAGDLEDRFIIQKTRMTRHMIKLLKYYHIYEKLGETMETRPIKFLRIMTRKHSPQKDNMQPIITMLVNLMKEIRLVPSGIPRREGVDHLLTLLPSPVVHKTVILKDVCNCGHISTATPDRAWVSDDDNLILIDTALGVGDTLHSRNDSLHEAVCGKHTVNYENELLYIDKNENIIKLCSDTKTTTIILKHTYSTKKPMCVYCSPSSGDLLVGLCERDTDSDTKVGAIIKRFDNTGKYKQTIPLNDDNLLFRWPRFISENNNGDVVVSDWGLRAVVVTSGEGVRRFSYDGPPSGLRIDPGGICTDVQSHILVCDGITKTIQMLDRDGQFMSYLLCVQDKPVSLSYDYTTHLLLVGSAEKKLSVYQYINRYLHLIDNTELCDSSVCSEPFNSRDISGFSQEEFDLLNTKPEADNEEYAQIIVDQIEEAGYKPDNAEEYAHLIVDQIEEVVSKAEEKAKRAAELVEKIALRENEHAAQKAAAKAREIKAEAETWKNVKRVAYDVFKSVFKRGSAALKGVRKWRK
uniref:Uncharacterized protein LOC111110585 isoform X3 n=1 Tax=Crassostrea virginica TaxID=6565 RepID=A0A8B8BHW3_CRAVI|nr:uncharacterized protein LOC111110585 isoform X3 [Crassostrea virginica]